MTLSKAAHVECVHSMLRLSDSRKDQIILEYQIWVDVYEQQCPFSLIEQRWIIDRVPDYI